MSVIGKLKPMKYEFQWKIEQFTSMMTSEVGSSFYSDYFTTGSEKIKWRLRMYPDGETEELKDYSALYVYHYGPSDITAVCSLSVFNESSKAVYQSTSMGPYTFRGGKGWGKKRFLEKKSIIEASKSTLKDDILTISCVICLSDIPQDSDDKTSTFDYFEELLDNGNFNDVTFVVGRKKISLHKAILTSISPVFQAMFQHDMKEKKENIVKITDIKYNIVMELFRYVYCRKVNNIDAIAEDLFVAADKYDITGLKRLCEQSILKNLNVDNALKCLLFVTTYETPYLKTKVIEFVFSNLKELIDKPEYEKMNVKCKDEIIKALANKKL